VLQAGGGEDPQDGVVGHHLQNQGITINFIDTKAKCFYLKKFVYKGTWLKVFIRVYRLEKHPVMLVFSTQLFDPAAKSLYRSIFLDDDI
jgi:hypothetical protein